MEKQNLIETTPEFHRTSYEKLNVHFESMFKNWDPIKNQLSLKDHFYSGKKTSLKSIRDYFPDLPEHDFKGVYVFIRNDIPFYVGISKEIIRRILQHLKGTDHYKSSFCYKIGAETYLKQNGGKHTGGRKGLPFEKWVNPVKEELFNCNVSIMAIEDDLELYLFEVFASMKLGTLYYNKFKTH
jgi:predicted GIY-YIG superfamily endonuclease